MTSAPSFWTATGKTNVMISDEILAFAKTLSEDEKDRRMAGLYFTSMESVWDADSSVKIRASDFDVIRRTKSQGLLFKSCYENLRCSIRNPDHSSGTANHKKNLLKLDCFGNPRAEAAHLLSHAPVCHKAFGYLGEAAVGLSVDTDEFQRVPGASKLKRRKILVGVKGGMHFTSLKGHKFNKVYCSGQKSFFDSEEPSMLLIPCLSFSEVMNWASSVETAKEYDCLVLTFGNDKSVAAGSVLSRVPGECSEEEIEDARILLSIFVKGVAGCVKGKDVLESFSPKELNNSKNVSVCRWKKLVDEIKANPNAKIGIPTPYTGERSGPLHVGRVRMTLGTSLPDPWLVMIKGAINYSAFRETKLMPSCPSLEDDDGPPNTTQGMEDDAYGTCAVSDAERASFLADSLNRSGFKERDTVLTAND